MQTNPYALKNDERISYEGFIEAEGMYAFRVHLREAEGMNSCVFQMALTQWLLDNLDSEDYKMGNDLRGVSNPDKADSFIRFTHVRDAVLFEQNFTVSGITLGLLA